MNWMNDFLSRCLEGVPKGDYRDRSKKELQDHLLALSQDLEASGYTSEEAHALAQERMGDPAELAQRYVQAWKQRRWRGWLFAFEMELFYLCVALVGLLYIANTGNFGKNIVGVWGFATIITAQFMSQSFYRIINKTWAATRWSCLVLVVFQLPPSFCWMMLGGPFEMSGVMVPGWAGLSVHTLFFLWGLANYKALCRLQLEDTASQTA